MNGIGFRGNTKLLDEDSVCSKMEHTARDELREQDEITEHQKEERECEKI